MGEDILRWLINFFFNLLGLGDIGDPFNVMVEGTSKLFPADYSATAIYKPLSNLIPVGIMLAMIYVSKEMLEKTAIKNIDLEQILKLFIKFLLAFVLVSNVGYLICGMNNFSMLLYNEISDKFTSLGNPNDIGKQIYQSLCIDIDTIQNPVAQGGGIFIDLLVLIISEVINLLVCAVFYIVIIFISVTRGIRLGYKSIWAPIAVANIIGYSTKNAAISYLKDLFASFLQLPIAYLGYCIGMSLVTGSTLDILGELVVFCTTLIWVATSARISKELFT